MNMRAMLSSERYPPLNIVSMFPSTTPARTRTVRKRARRKVK